MSIDRALYRNGALAFAIFLAFALLAFWPSYFSRLFLQPSYHVHAHGIAMTLWCVMLVAQALLIRKADRDLHKRIGKLGYALVPLVAATTIHLAHFRLQAAPAVTAPVMLSTALMVNGTVVFVVFYLLAMLNRHTPAVHARFMLCTVFPLFTPVTDRLIFAHAPAVLAYVPRLNGSPVAPAAGFALADLILIGLSLWDWRSNRRLGVFPVALGILVLYHWSVLLWHRYGFWEDFTAWFLGLPLS